MEHAVSVCRIILIGISGIEPEASHYQNADSAFHWCVPRQRFLLTNRTYPFAGWDHVFIEEEFPEGYRKNVAVIVRDPSNGKLLFCRRCESDNWQFPQGGIDNGEDVMEAMYRELYEEVGLDKDDINIVAISKEWITYDIPTSIRIKFKGQIQKWYFVDLVSPKEKIDLNQDPKPEFDKYEWVTYWYPLGKIIDFKKEAYRKVLIEFAEQM